MSPVSIGQIGSYLREQREQATLSVRLLAQAAGVPDPYLSQLERGLRRPGADLLQQLARGLRTSAEALNLPAGAGAGAVRDAMLTDPELTERQKQVLAEIYDSFRKENAMAAAGHAPEADEQAGVTPPARGPDTEPLMSPARPASR